MRRNYTEMRENYADVLRKAKTSSNRHKQNI